ncbi:MULTISPECIES: hypothetical protein [Streptomyces]|uniref:hypothetical protein n=1 Tax=Streptomyces TaxID=1883 RepID=UPI00340BD7E7
MTHSVEPGAFHLAAATAAHRSGALQPARPAASRPVENAVLFADRALFDLLSLVRRIGADLSATCRPSWTTCTSSLSPYPLRRLAAGPGLDATTPAPEADDIDGDPAAGGELDSAGVCWARPGRPSPAAAWLCWAEVTRCWPPPALSGAVKG